jgi:hypothetical protein
MLFAEIPADEEYNRKNYGKDKAQVGAQIAVTAQKAGSGKKLFHAGFKRWPARLVIFLFFFNFLDSFHRLIAGLVAALKDRVAFPRAPGEFRQCVSVQFARLIYLVDTVFHFGLLYFKGKFIMDLFSHTTGSGEEKKNGGSRRRQPAW